MDEQGRTYLDLIERSALLFIKHTADQHLVDMAPLVQRTRDHLIKMWFAHGVLAERVAESAYQQYLATHRA